ncbi:hypothetical protein JCGZ_27133 [Jatropha curcas]|uniref:Pentacotripeptide-repeat region of PRORP domain-containing protein n=1 Tax=Jatropha curcas TaxID=180498 RepID=A0A067JWE4_JATCU|nr:pentatricopeptide repeat-containing protein At1g31430 [Jatropha curcas]KDP23864.1 hypothetical protein JCGZ_27133 [Jatropha curcas]
MYSKHLLKILLFLKQKSNNFKFNDQILAQTITTGLSLTHPTPTCNCLIRAYSQSPTPIKAVLAYNYFIKIGSNSNFADNYTYPALLKACCRLSSIPNGKQLHAHVIKTGLDCDIYVANSLLHFYGFLAQFTDARFLFDKMSKRDIASWNTIMGAYTTSSNSIIEIMAFFKRLMCENVRADNITLVILLSACVQEPKLEFGRVVHDFVIKMGFGSILNVNNALLNMYTKYKEMDSALKVFDELDHWKDVVSYTILINGYVEIGLIDLGIKIFHQIIDKDVGLWNLMIHAYVKAKRPTNALELFKKMGNEGVMPDQNTMVSLLAACASLLDLQYGRLLHMFINSNNVKQDVYVKTALIDMYSKCGSVEEALVIFYKMEYRDVFTWTAMIEGLANNGYGNEAMKFFMRMEEEGIQPNEATFVSVLTGCSHSGFVNEGSQLFKKMVEVYSLQPKNEHFGCLIDLLSRAGLLYQAEEFVKLLLPEERFTAYKILLSACIKYSEFEVGEKVAYEMVKLKSHSHETHVLLSNFHAVAGQWERVAKTRRMMKELKTRKNPGFSSVS